ncbi:anhydro-N-acetylmuramic acid kinase [Calothrix sp. NIES-3974]|uniref:anhydro-N-acetylmuramic acid kinase n=1 Tax=Calothrix sp. NIES-3974 TaxID=2005462 RepID=UPI000B5DDB81|nr:anhydro-N-acetylmuramic acid kinase [Calothrix sp. NIES-3974]BAZ08135.1 hypothetical protein NIES3974_48040 [Calothrix sp. NIES-3974]
MRVIGLMSGTSVDGIDAALIEIEGENLDIQVDLIAGATIPYPETIRSQILAVCAGEPLTMAALADLDDAIASCFATAALEIQSGHPPAELIGSHGQTIYHRPPNASLGYSWQIGRADLIAHITQTMTISNFRAADIACGGQGAPMVPRVDAALLSDTTESRCIQNIGGIGNVTYLPAAQGDWLGGIRGWDTGPGNSLIDLAVSKLTNGEKTYDQNGNWASQGIPCDQLVKNWLQHEYFHQVPPKSTGRELFGVAFLEKCFRDADEYHLEPADILASLTELTALSIIHDYQAFLTSMPDRVLLCGGGSKNLYLKSRLQAGLDPIPVVTTDDFGVSADFKEAIAFAVLAYWRYQNVPGNLPAVTGASREVILGEIHPPVFNRE